VANVVANVVTVGMLNDASSSPSPGMASTLSLGLESSARLDVPSPSEQGSTSSFLDIDFGTFDSANRSLSTLSMSNESNSGDDMMVSGRLLKSREVESGGEAIASGVPIAQSDCCRILQPVVVNMLIRASVTHAGRCSPGAAIFHIGPQVVVSRIHDGRSLSHDVLMHPVEIGDSSWSSQVLFDVLAVGFRPSQLVGELVLKGASDIYKS